MTGRASLTPGPAEGEARGGRIVLVRHGETEWSRNGRHTGRTDLKLTAEGRRQAELVARRLAHEWPAREAFAAVRSSPLSRALETARIAIPDARLEVDPDLAEWDYGAFEGLTTPEIRRDVPDWAIWTHPAPGGETVRAIERRADRVVARLREDGGDVLVFSHGHFLRVLAARWVGQPVAFGGRLALSTASISVLGWERERPAIERWNETGRREGRAR